MQESQLHGIKGRKRASSVRCKHRLEASSPHVRHAVARHCLSLQSAAVERATPHVRFVTLIARILFHRRRGAVGFRIWSNEEISGVGGRAMRGVCVGSGLLAVVADELMKSEGRSRSRGFASVNRGKRVVTQRLAHWSHATTTTSTHVASCTIRVASLEGLKFQRVWGQPTEKQ